MHLGSGPLRLIRSAGLLASMPKQIIIKKKKKSQLKLYQEHHQLRNRFQCLAAKGVVQDGGPACGRRRLLCGRPNGRPFPGGLAKSLDKKTAAKDAQQQPVKLVAVLAVLFL